MGMAHRLGQWIVVEEKLKMSRLSEGLEAVRKEAIPREK